MTQEERAEGRRLLEAWEAARNDYAMRTSGLVEAADRFNEATLSLSDFLLTHARALLSDGWMPIETAEKGDQKWQSPRFLLLCPKRGVRMGVFDPDAYSVKKRPFWSIDGSFGKNDDRLDQPTHWQPPPTPPEPHND